MTTFSFYYLIARAVPAKTWHTIVRISNASQKRCLLACNNNSQMGWMSLSSVSRYYPCCKPSCGSRSGPYGLIDYYLLMLATLLQELEAELQSEKELRKATELKYQQASAALTTATAKIEQEEYDDLEESEEDEYDAEEDREEENNVGTIAEEGSKDTSKSLVDKSRSQDMAAEVEDDNNSEEGYNEDCDESEGDDDENSTEYASS